MGAAPTPPQHRTGRSLDVAAVIALALLAVALIELGMFLFADHASFELGMQVTLLFALIPLAFVIHVVVGPGTGDQRRLLGPLVIFTIAFVLTLGPRALLLATGEPGRFFVLNSSTGSTAAAFIAPPAQRRERTLNTVRNPFVEASTRDWGTPVSNARGGFAAKIVRARADGFEGHSSAEADVRTGTDGSYVGVPIGNAFEAKAQVTPGHIVSGSIAVKSLQRLPRGRLDLEVIYYDAKQQYVSDRPLSGPGSRAGISDPAAGRWYQLFGTSRVPRRAGFGNLLVVVHGFKDDQRRTFRLDAAQLIANARSRSEFFTDVPPDVPGIWSHAARRALTVSILMLLAVFLGYMVPLGARMGRRVPDFALRGLEDRRTKRFVLALTAVSVLGYIAEMSTYGGYRGYLETFANNPTAALGKFYLHTLATLSTGAAVLLLAHRLAVGRRAQWRWLEVVVIPLGFGIALSYFLKAVIAIPLLTVLLYWYFLRRRAIVWLGAFIAGFAALTPFVYLVRGQGQVHLSDLLTSDYWSEFLANLQSRFYHFESLMLAMPFRGSGHPWQPAVDFFANTVPRALWHAKPLSTNARFTREYLQGGLHARSDIGVLSLPGELWLIGGWAAVLIGALGLGVLLRLVHALLIRRQRHTGTMLVAATLMTFLVFLNDGWGLASALTSVLIIGVGWLVPLRLISSGGNRVKPAGRSDLRSPARVLAAVRGVANR